MSYDDVHERVEGILDGRRRPSEVLRIVERDHEAAQDREEVDAQMAGKKEVAPGLVLGRERSEWTAQVVRHDPQRRDGSKPCQRAKNCGARLRVSEFHAHAGLTTPDSERCYATRSCAGIRERP